MIYIIKKQNIFFKKDDWSGENLYFTRIVWCGAPQFIGYLILLIPITLEYILFIYDISITIIYFFYIPALVSILYRTYILNNMRGDYKKNNQLYEKQIDVFLFKKTILNFFNKGIRLLYVYMFIMTGVSIMVFFSDNSISEAGIQVGVNGYRFIQKPNFTNIPTLLECVGPALRYFFTTIVAKYSIIGLPLYIALRTIEALYVGIWPIIREFFFNKTR